MRHLVSRLARLERLSRLSTAPQRLRIQSGYLKKLPDDNIGPRHIVTVRRLPPGPGAYPGEDWFQREERPGPGPPSSPTGPDVRSSSMSTTWRRSRRPESAPSPNGNPYRY